MIRKCLKTFGGASRDRTDDLIVANDALSQLSYSPITSTRIRRFYQLASHPTLKRSHQCSGLYAFASSSVTLCFRRYDRFAICTAIAERCPVSMDALGVLRVAIQ